jgi:predicted GNAT family acetyltransferase
VSNPLRSLLRIARQEGIARACHHARFAVSPQTFGIWLLRGECRVEAAQQVETDRALLRRLRAGREALAPEFFRDEAHPEWACSFVVENGSPVAVAWAMTEGSRFIRLGEDAGEITGIYVAPEARGRGLAKAVTAHACRLLHARGRQHCYMTVHRENAASQRVAADLGFVKVADIRRPALIGRRYIAEATPEIPGRGAMARETGS